MAALTTRDAERALRFVADAESLGVDEPFAPEVLEELGKLVSTETLTYQEQDRVRQRIRYTTRRRGEDWDAAAVVSYWEIAAEHPVCSRHNKGEFQALKLSDFLGLRQLRRSRIYAVWFSPIDVERELAVAIPSPPWHTKTFLFDRGRGRDFSERDRLVLDLLQPHFGRLWRTAKARRGLKAAMTGLDWASEQDSRGVILLSSDGRIEFASPPAERLMRAYFGAQHGAELPAALAEWLDSGSPRLVRALTGRRLTVHRSGAALLLEETRDELGLTAREREVLGWVARGKTNAEIAMVLWIAPTTVRKHLENIYAKLGVRTRTAAAARLLGILDDEEQPGEYEALDTLGTRPS